MSEIFEELKWRGLVYDHTEGLADLSADQKLVLYNGFDPTADSLHVGHLVPMVGLARWQRFGHHPIAVAGGGTGMVGDPSGRSTERNLLSAETIAANVEVIKAQLASILDFEVKSNPARLVNNADWLGELRVIDFLRDVGKYFTIQYMIGKDSVQSRLDREDGLSFTEFSYMLMQAYDFLHLHDRYGCRLQTGGSDQWGNITAGSTLIRKVRGHAAHGLVYPLITRADGSKFGKTAEGDSVWLSPQRTSPYRFYQFFYNIEDAKVIEMLCFYTFLSRAEINVYADQVATQPEQRVAQRRLAQEVTLLVHGPTALARAETASAVLFGGELEGLEAADIQEIFADVPSSVVSKDDLAGDGLSLTDLLVGSQIAASKGEARRAIQGGGVYLNNRRVTEADSRVSITAAVDGQFIVLRKGRKHYHLVRVI